MLTPRSLKIQDREYTAEMFFGKKIRAFRNTFRGIKIAWLEEHNFQFHSVAAVAVVAAGWYFDITKTEWFLAIFMIGFVMTAEVFNTALEELCDKFQPEHDPHIGKIKDLAAAAVFIASTTSAIVGLMIFLPYLFALLL